MGDFFGRAWASLDGFGQEMGKHVGPAVEDAWKKADGFEREIANHVGPAMGEVWKAADGFGQEVGKNLRPAGEDAWKVADGFGQEVGKHVGPASGEVVVWTGFHVASGVVSLAPGIVTAPVLGALGWTAMGPQAASVAAALQTASTPARGIFATLQSAAMGGYGASVLAGGTRLVVVAATFIGAVTPKPPSEHGEDTQQEDGDRDEDDNTMQSD